MAKKSAANKAKRQQARAKKRAKRAKQVKASGAAQRAGQWGASSPRLDSRVGDWASSWMASALLGHMDSSRRVVVFNPHAVAPGDTPCATPQATADSPDIVALPYARTPADDDGVRWPDITSVAIFQRDGAGDYEAVAPYGLPDDTEVTWWSDESFDWTVSTARIGWTVEPAKSEGRLRGELRVQHLVNQEDGVFWSPTYPFESFERPGGGWELRVGLGLLDGVLRDGEVEWTSSGIGEVVERVAAFISAQAKQLTALIEEPEAELATDDPVALFGAIRGPSPRYKRRALNALVANASAVLPRVVEYLASLDPMTVDENDFSAIYALALVAHTRCTDAHEPLLALAKRPDPEFEQAFSDMITEDLSSALLLTCGGNTDGIVELMNDPAAGPYLRGAAALALSGAVLVGQADRSDVLERLSTALDTEEAWASNGFLDCVTLAMLELFPVEYSESLLRAVRGSHIDSMTTSEEDVTQMVVDGPALASDGKRCVMAYYSTDVHRWLGDWPCFR